MPCFVNGSGGLNENKFTCGAVSIVLREKIVIYDVLWYTLHLFYCRGNNMAKKKKSLRTQIEDRGDDYSRIQKKLVVFLMESWNEIPLMSIEDISKETGVSTATISRFAMLFDYKGFYDFKEAIKEEHKNTINPVDRFRLLKADLSGKKPLIKVAKQDVKNINKLISMVKEETFTQLRDMINSAPRLYCYGVSVSSIFSQLISYIFNQIQKESYCLNDGSITPEERILTINKEDLVIFCSFYPYTRSTIEFAQLAHEQGLQVVAISDNQFSPISEYAELVMAIPNENVLFTSSISAFSVLINALATEIAYKNKNKLSEAIKHEYKTLKKFYYLS